MIKVNPFPRLSIPKNTNIVFDPDGSIAKAVRLAIATLSSKDIASITVIGGYGYGKTHVLKYLENVLKSFGAKTFYIPSPGKSIMDIYRVVIENSLEDLDQLSDIDPQIKNVLDIAKSSSDLSNYAKMWLLGERLPLNIRYRLGIGSNIDEVKALTFLRSILRSLASRYKGAVLLIDELEALLSLSKNRRLVYIENLRNLVDTLPPATLIVVALTPACWDEIVNANAALARRLSSMIIYLRNLKRDEVEPFLELYLRSVDPKLSILDVFENEVLDYIYELSNGNPGELLKLAAIIVDEIVIPMQRRATLNDAKNILAVYA